jgi:glycosyltransferase involved in cell wall biosynthesis
VAVRLLKAVERVSTAVASHVIVANPLWYERVVQRCASSRKCSTYWYYPDRAIFHPRPKASRTNFVMLYPGTLHWHQGIDIALKAMPRILAQIPEAELHIYGDGPAKTDLVNLTTRLGLTEHIRFRDTLPTAQIAERMADSDVGIVPKRAGCPFGNEAASTKIPEFLAVGVPVVASRTKIDVCLYGETMIRFFESESEEALASAVVAVSRDTTLRESLVAAGLAYAAENNWATRAPEYVQLAESLAYGRRS